MTVVYNSNYQPASPKKLSGLNIDASQFKAVGNYTQQQIGNFAQQQTNNSSSYTNGDTIILKGLKTDQMQNPFQTQQPSVNFNQIGGNIDVDNAIAQLNNIYDPSERSVEMRNLFISLLDNDDINGAVKVINSTPVLIYKNAMFKSLVQELVASGEYDTAIRITSNYPDQRIQNELRSYLEYYINYFGNDSTKAAEAGGDASISHIAALKVDSIMGSVGTFFSGIGSSIASIFSSPSKAANIAHSANNIVGQQYRYAHLDGGNLACAYAVSQMIKGAGITNISSAECNTLAGQLSKNGFKKVAGTNYQQINGKVNYQPGDVVFFTRNGKQGFGHVGVVAEVINGIPYMVHNSSSKRAVVKVRLDQYYKTPVAVYRA